MTSNVGGAEAPARGHQLAVLRRVLDHAHLGVVHRFRTKKLQPGDVLEHTLQRPARGTKAARVVVENMNDDWVILHDVEIYRAD